MIYQLRDLEFPKEKQRVRKLINFFFLLICARATKLYNNITPISLKFLQGCPELIFPEVSSCPLKWLGAVRWRWKILIRELVSDFKSENVSGEWWRTKRAFFPSGLFLRVNGKQWQHVCVSWSLLKQTLSFCLSQMEYRNVIALCSFLACHCHLGTSNL